MLGSAFPGPKSIGGAIIVIPLAVGVPSAIPSMNWCGKEETLCFFAGGIPLIESVR